jgi:hypothetical protein
MKLQMTYDVRNAEKSLPARVSRNIQENRSAARRESCQRPALANNRRSLSMRMPHTAWRMTFDMKLPFSTAVTCVFGLYGIVWGRRDSPLRKGAYERIHRIFVPGGLVGVFVF